MLHSKCLLACVRKSNCVSLFACLCMGVCVQSGYYLGTYHDHTLCLMPLHMIASKKFHMDGGTWAIEAEPIGSTSNLSNISVILRPNSFSSTSCTSVNGVAGDRSHRVTSLLTHAAGAKSGFPTI